MTESVVADKAHRAQMGNWLQRAADMLNVSIDADLQFGWFDRTAGARARTDDGIRWLRLVQETHEWAYGDFWTGNEDADAIRGVRKPRVLDAVEWSDDERRYRAELMTFVPDQPIATMMTVSSSPALAPSWWSDLRASLDAVSAHPTTRVRIDHDRVHHDLLVAFGLNVASDRLDWTTAHGDLHWANLTAPTCWLLDWESWGTAPKGYDAATLYCVSLLDTDTAAKVRAEFTDLLDTPGGAIAQLAATVRLLKFVERGRYANLAPALHREAQRAIRTHLPETAP